VHDKKRGLKVIAKKDRRVGDKTISNEGYCLLRCDNLILVFTHIKRKKKLVASI
jgi:hypothetical protein